MSNNDAIAAIVSLYNLIRSAHLQLSDIHSSIESLRLPLFRAEDGLQTVARRLDLPAVTLNPFNFAFADVDLEICTHTSMSQLSIPLSRPEHWEQNLGEENLAEELRKCVIVFGIEGAQGADDFYIVCGAALLAEYCKIEVDDDALAFLQRKTIRRHLLSAKPAPFGTLNLAPFVFLTSNILKDPLSLMRISTVTWKIPNFTYFVHIVPNRLLKKIVRDASEGISGNNSKSGETEVSLHVDSETIVNLTRGLRLSLNIK